MAAPCRSWWRNCAVEADAEIEDIDRMEDRLAPIGAQESRIRNLISSLELCHHKADRWVYNIIEAIGTGSTAKGLGTRSRHEKHPAEQVWQNACAALSAWCAGCPSTQLAPTVGSVPAARLLAGLGQRSPLKEWQVQRVIEKIRSTIDWSPSAGDSPTHYHWMLLGGDEYECAYRTRCPEHYAEHEGFWRATACTIIRDTEGGDAAELSLGLAIDMLMPCHWRFVDNLRIVLDAIGGMLTPAQPFAACGRNITLLPIRRRMEIVSETLKAFSTESGAHKETDARLLALLGAPTDPKRWLAASLDKTMRLQLHPPAALRAIAALAGPDWIRQ